MPLYGIPHDSIFDSCGRELSRIACLPAGRQRRNHLIVGIRKSLQKVFRRTPPAIRDAGWDLKALIQQCLALPGTRPYLNPEHCADDMTFGSIFSKSSSLRPAWTYTTDFMLWRIIASGTGELLGEERDVAKKEVRFFCLNQQTGKVIWKTDGLHDRWWVGMEGVHKDVMLLHGFASPDLPGNKGVSAVDIATGNRLWKHDELMFLRATGTSVFASKQETISGESILELDYRSGALLKSWGANRQAIQQGADEESPTAVYPTHLLSPADEAELRRHASSGEWASDPQMIRTDRFAIFHVATKKDDAIHPMLLVIDSSKETVVFRDELEVHTPASFFVDAGFVFFLKHRSSIVALKLA